MSEAVRPDLVEMRVTGDVAVAVIIPANLDDSNAEPLARQLAALVEASGRVRLDLDLGNVRSLDGGVVGRIVGLHRKVKAAGGQLRLLNVDGVVDEALRVTKLDIRRKAAG